MQKQHKNEKTFLLEIFYHILGRIFPRRSLSFIGIGQLFLFKKNIFVNLLVILVLPYFVEFYYGCKNSAETGTLFLGKKNPSVKGSPSEDEVYVFIMFKTIFLSKKYFFCLVLVLPKRFFFSDCVPLLNKHVSLTGYPV